MKKRKGRKSSKGTSPTDPSADVALLRKASRRLPSILPWRGPKRRAVPVPEPGPARIGLVVGLGNPGARYDGTRHNIGYEAVTAVLAERPFEARHFDGGILVDAEISGRRISLLRPTGYMNRSGGAVRRFLAGGRLRPAETLVVCDDYALPLGAIRTRRRGSDGGHNGLASVFGALGTTDVPRMRLGIGAPRAGEDPADYVLAPFASREADDVADLLERAALAIEAAIGDGLDAAMNRFNRTPA